MVRWQSPTAVPTTQTVLVVGGGQERRYQADQAGSAVLAGLAPNTEYLVTVLVQDEWGRQAMASVTVTTVPATAAVCGTAQVRVGKYAVPTKSYRVCAATGDLRLYATAAPALGITDRVVVLDPGGGAAERLAVLAPDGSVRPDRLGPVDPGWPVVAELGYLPSAAIPGVDATGVVAYSVYDAVASREVWWYQDDPAPVALVTGTQVPFTERARAVGAP